MKRKWLKLRTVMTICAALGWWGLLYPEFTLTPETITIYEEDTLGGSTLREPSWEFNRDLYHSLLSADREDITFRSKFLENLSLFWEALQNEIE